MKKSIALILSVVLMVALAACGVVQSTPSDSAPSASASPSADAAPSADASPSTPAAADAVLLKAAHSVAPTHPYHLGLERYAELVEERTGGKVKIDIFHSAQLGNERDCIEGLQMGTLDIAVSATGPVSGFVPQFMVVDLPYLFSDYEHADRVLDGEVGQELLASLSDVNVVGAAFWENGFRQITNSKRPINSVEDVKGLKLRTMENEVHMESFRVLGADPTPMAWSEVFTALQQGVIDGQENPIPIIYTSKLDEVQNYLAISRHFYSPSPLLISPITLTQFDEATQKMLIDIAKEVAPYQRGLIRQQEEEQISLLEQQGMEITYPDQEAFRNACQPVYEKYGEQLGKDLIDKILNG